MPQELDAVIQFLQQPNTDYAYMLSGAWGSGKTFFWKHVVLPRLRGMSDTDDLLAYVSLYGMRDSSEIRIAVFAHLHPLLSTAGKAASFLMPAFLGKAGLSAPDPQKLSDWISAQSDHLDSGKRLVLCFDDLERAAMPAETALGQINQFVEHAGAKVVILCNEEEIPNQDTYLRTKEKVIRITRKYNTNPTEAIPAIVAEFATDANYHKFLQRNRDLVIDIVRRSGLRNLRTLKYALLVLQVAYKEFSRLLPNDEELLRQYLKMLLSVGLDLQEHKITDRDAKSFLTAGNGAIVGAHFGKKDGELNPLIDFGARYGFGGLEQTLPTSHALAQLIATGYLDAEALRSEIDEQKADQTPGKRAAKSLEHWFALADDLLGAVVSTALEAVRAGEITSPEKLYNLANTFGWMGSEGVPGILDGTAEHAFDEGIAQISKDWIAAKPEIHVSDRPPFGGKHERPLGEFVRALLIKVDQEMHDRRLKLDFDAAFKAIQTDPNAFVRFLIDERGTGVGRSPIASLISPDRFAHAVMAASNEVLYEVGGGLRIRYSENFITGELASDLQWLEDFQSILSQHTAEVNTSTPARKMMLCWTLEYAREAIARIQQLTNASHGSER